MNYQLRRMKRKTVGIYITKEGEIEVRAPRSVSEAEIDRLVQEKEAWITTHQTKMRERIQLQAMDEFGPAGRLYFSAGVIRPSLRKQGIFPSMERAFCCPICRRQSCAPPLLTFTAKRQKPFCQVRWSALPHSLERPPSRCASPRPKRAGAPARQKAGSIFLAPPVRAAGSNGLRCRPRACASDRIQSLFSFLGNCRRNSAGLQGPPPILERSAGEPPKAGMVKRMREIHKSILLLMQWKERSG